MHYTQSTISSYQNVVRDIVFPINQEELQRFLKSDALEAIISVAKHIKDMPSTLKDLTGNQIVKVEGTARPIQRSVCLEPQRGINAITEVGPVREGEL